ncbi:ATP-dependent DNA helicase YKU70 Ecym_4620 [Eremothecium cymbalariae DBVPG|uniref:DNA helicase n=1 Tax=Eremothecium cymbalariae (strain CBS 270.75 / DBVPG 7215 / KCTC 17166 / NRRL Y-17582) TaxID=931890 RepID=G8JSC7_ERECY|nr:hypothetical protein Ecym_4620 [Eremothecium cymbalariae DBVPG\
MSMGDPLTKVQHSKNIKHERRQSIIVCIELSSRVYQSSEISPKAQLAEMLEALLELMKQLAMLLPNSEVCCYVYQCRRLNVKDGIYELLPLEMVNVQKIHKISQLLSDIKNKKMFLKDEIPFEEIDGSPLSSVLAKIQHQLQGKTTDEWKFRNKRIILITANDMPAEYFDAELQKKFKNTINALYDDSFSIVTFFIHSQTRPFNDTFYADLLKPLRRPEDLDKNIQYYDGPNTKPIEIKELKGKLLQKKEGNKFHFKCAFIINKQNDFIISLKGFFAITQEKAGERFKYIYQKGAKPQDAFSHRKFYNANDGEAADSRLTKVFDIGGLNIEFTEEQDQKMINSFSEHETFLELIGFRSVDKVNFYYNNISTSSYVIPDDNVYEGSSKTLSHLYASMTKKGKAAIVWGKLTRIAHPQLFLMVAMDRKNTNQGFYLVRLPFIEEIRRFPQTLQKNRSVNIQEYALMKKITGNIIAFFNLKSSYRAAEFPSPVLKSFYTTLSDKLLQKSLSDQWGMGFKLSNDITLGKVQHLRELINKSSQNMEQPILAKYMKYWNTYYNKEGNNSITNRKKLYQIYSGDPQVQKSMRIRATNAKSVFNL